MNSDTNISLKFKNWVSRESTIHFLLWVLYFVVLAYQKNRVSLAFGGPSQLQFVDFVFAINYFLVIMVINYYLLPKFFYYKRYLLFLVLSIVLLTGAVVVEEFILEKLFFPGTNRAKYFLGFVPNLLQIGPVILFFVGFKLAWDNLKKQNRLEQVEKEHTESQLQFLKSQLNPHFLFNNLNNLYSYAQERSPKTPEIIMQLSTLMRYMLYESRETFVPLEKDLKYLEDFIQLEKLQMEARGIVEYDVKGDLRGKRIAPMILIAFVENCFKHSQSGQAEDIFIEIKAYVDENQLTFECVNNFSEVSNPSSEYLEGGIGLENVRKRLELLYPGKHSLKTYVQDNMYFVELRLDLIVNGK